MHEEKLLINKGLKKIKHNEEPQNMYCLLSTVRPVTSTRMDRWAKIVVCKNAILSKQRWEHI
jgi:hypothetical protein